MYSSPAAKERDLWKRSSVGVRDGQLQVSDVQRPRVGDVESAQRRIVAVPPCVEVTLPTAWIAVTLAITVLPAMRL